MRNIWLLTKVQLGSTLNLNFKSVNRDRKKRTGIPLTIFILLFTLLLSVTSFGYSFAVGTSLKMVGMVSLLPELMMALTSVITIVTTIYKVKGTLFEFKDYDLIMSLPVKTSEIVASRFVLLYLINILFTFIIMVPNIIAYGILTNPNIMFYFISCLELFFIPFIPMIVASLIGTIITVIATRFRHSSFANLVITIGFFVGFLIFSFQMDDSKEALGEMSASLTKSVDNIYPLAGLYRSAVCNYNLLAVVAFLFISTLAFVLFSILVGINFKWINTSIAANYTRSNYKLGKQEQTSPFMALYRKEMKRYFSSTLYVLNTAMGIVMMTIGAIATLFVKPETLAEILEIPGASGYIAIAAPIFISFCVIMTYITACSISLEGKNLWILKVSPLPAYTIFNSKIAVSLTITIPAIFVTGTIITIGLKLNFIEAMMVFLMPMAYAFLAAILGLVINLKLPNLNWTSETAVIKQSAASMIASLGGLVIAAIPIGMILLFSDVNKILINGFTSVIISLLSILAYRYLITKGGRILQSL